VPAPVDLVLLRALLPDLALRPGAHLAARVLDARTILLAGARVAAQLPDDVAAGDVLRLRVQEASSERLVLKIVERPEAAVAGQPPLVALPLPGLADARLLVEDDAATRPAGEPRRAVTLRYDSPRLGRIDIVLGLGAEAVSATVFAPAGEPVEAVRRASGALREALLEGVGRPAQVTVQARAETVDVRA
jgi:hypothetical protein